MFDNQDIIQLVTGNLSRDAYQHIVDETAALVNRHKWPKGICTSESEGDWWTDDDIKELTHAFIEWGMTKGKFNYLTKIPTNYLGYYFTQILVSYVADRIKLMQEEETGFSFRQCEEIVKAICKSHYEMRCIEGKDMVALSWENAEANKKNINDMLEYLPRYTINNDRKKTKVSIALAIEDVINAAGVLDFNALCKAVYTLVSYNNEKSSKDNDVVNPFMEETSEEYNDIVEKMISDVNDKEANMILDYLFLRNGKVSLSEMEKKYNMPKSTIHHKMDSFRKKIIASYTPENEEDGIAFLKKIAILLDEKAK